MTYETEYFWKVFFLTDYNLERRALLTFDSQTEYQGI